MQPFSMQLFLSLFEKLCQINSEINTNIFASNFILIKKLKRIFRQNLFAESKTSMNSIC